MQQRHGLVYHPQICRSPRTLRHHLTFHGLVLLADKPGADFIVDDVRAPYTAAIPMSPQCHGEKKTEKAMRGRTSLGLGCLFNSRVPHPSLSDVPKPSGFFFLPLLQSGGDGMCYTPFLVQLSQTV